MASLLQTSTIPKLPVLKNSIYTMVAAFAGVIFGVLGSLGFMTSYLNSQFALQTASLSHKVVSMQAASDTTMCTAPSSTGSGSGSNKSKAVTAAHVAPANAPVAPANGGNGGGGNGGGSQLPFVKQLISANISDTGPHSNNSITASNTNTTTVTNNNNIGVSNFNAQGASSGSAHVSDNTTAGGASTGTAQNDNSTNTNIHVNN